MIHPSGSIRANKFARATQNGMHPLAVKNQLSITCAGGRNLYGLMRKTRYGALRDSLYDVGGKARQRTLQSRAACLCTVARVWDYGIDAGPRPPPRLGVRSPSTHGGRPCRT